MKEYLLGIDVGTSSCKVAVFAKNGEVIASTSADYPVAYPHAGWAEQDPPDWWDGICLALRALWQSRDGKCPPFATVKATWRHFWRALRTK